MKRTAIIVGIVSGALSFAVGFAGGAVLNRPSRQNNDAKIAKIRSETEQSNNEIIAKLQKAQALAQGLEKENRQLNIEIRNMKTALEQIELSSVNGTKQQTSKVEIIRKPIFGIYLGEKISAVQKRFNTTKHPLGKWELHLSSDVIEGCHINVCKDRVCCITVWLKDNSKKNFDLLKQQQKNEYEDYQIREIKSSRSKSVDPRASITEELQFKITLDETPVLVSLTFIDNFTGYMAYPDDMRTRFPDLGKNELSIQFLHTLLDEG